MPKKNFKKYNSRIVYQSFQSIRGGKLAVGLFQDQVYSKAWAKLTGNAVKIYIYMLTKYKPILTTDRKAIISSNKDDISIPHREYTGNDPDQKWILEIGQSAFEAAIDNLIEYGFIRVVEYRPMEYTKLVVIYGFTDRWQQYDGETPLQIPHNDRRAGKNPKIRRAKKNKEGSSPTT